MTPVAVQPATPARPTWVAIPGGTFRMGGEDGYEAEKPVHEVTVAPFEMPRSEITVAQYMECVDAGACREPDWHHGTCYSKDRMLNGERNGEPAGSGDDGGGDAA